jgi:hypothetical protein
MHDHAKAAKSRAWADPFSTHSHGIRPHPHGHAIAKSLLSTAVAPARDDNRPLIDRLHEATFTDPVGLQWIKDKYALRMLVRKAHCFMLDDMTSSLIADFSLAISTDLEAARRLAIPPFPVTWIDINNRMRLKRIKELGVPLTPTAAGETAAGEPVERVGWLIHPGDLGGFFATYVTAVDEGVMLTPLSYWWHAGKASPLTANDETSELIQWMTFGVKDPNVHSIDAYPSTTTMHDETLMVRGRKGYADAVREMMGEIAGELRHIWGFLIALGAGQLGVVASTTPQPRPEGPPPLMKNGKPLLPLEHKRLHLHLARRITPVKLVARAISRHRMREHEVRAHWRTLRNPDGSVRKRVPVKDHKRGDERLGRITKTYHVER